jgi:hypothetical protein
MDMPDEELGAAVIAQSAVMSYGYIEEKWALMTSDFAEEEGNRKMQALRSLGPARGFGAGLETRLKPRLAALKEALGSAPKASEWFRWLGGV